MRKLASVQRIVSLDPIPGADRIEVAQVLGWQVVVQKDLYEVGDLVVYFEIDSILPAKSWCAFMEDRKYRVRTIKLRKQISQGLCIPMGECLQEGVLYLEDEDVTTFLGVKKHDPEAAWEANKNSSTKRQPVPHAWMMRFGVTRWLHQKIYPRKKGSWPQWMPKTDETRVQNLPLIDTMVLDRSLYYSEKLDGQSITCFYVRNEKTGLFSRGLFGVCSRNIWYKNPVSNNWWNMATGLDIEERLRTYCDNNGKSLALQGEIVGPGIQKNRYMRQEREVYWFNVWDIDAECYLSLKEKAAVLDLLGLQSVPICSLTFIPHTHHDYVGMADGFSTLVPGVRREGLVFRDVLDDGFSFKSISNKFLLREGK